MSDLRDHVCLVTGAGRGIGRAIAHSLVKAGAHVCLAARTESELHAVAQELPKGASTILPVDLADETRVIRVFEHISKIHGRLDSLINNAGIGFYGTVHGFKTEHADQMLAVNIRGTFLCCREALKLMIPKKSGYIISISSVLGFKGYANQGVYAATKHAVMGLTKTLAVECQPHNIRVSAVLPGGVDTEMVVASRPDLDRSVLMSPDDVADAVLYLLSLSKTNAAVDQIYIRRKLSSPF
ncbi:MAG TPA: SDR family oxidoreductase [Tepidisphaeraceae bacterium]|nr:SDR family oxidoreductase [Tepidisphaeraceae bacterium]